MVTDLGNSGAQSVFHQMGDGGEQIANLALFSHVQYAAYWSGTEHAAAPTNAWGFITQSGTQIAHSRATLDYAMAVRDGDVAAPVPELGTLALFGIGLGGMAAVRRRVTVSWRRAAA